MVYRVTATLSREQCREDGAQDGSEKGNTNEMTHGLKRSKERRTTKKTKPKPNKQKRNGSDRSCSKLTGFDHTTQDVTQMTQPRGHSFARQNADGSDC